MILELSQHFHGIHSFNSTEFVRQNIQLGYRSDTGHGRGGYDSAESSGIDRDFEPCNSWHSLSLVLRM